MAQIAFTTSHNITFIYSAYIKMNFCWRMSVIIALVWASVVSLVQADDNSTKPATMTAPHNVTKSAQVAKEANVNRAANVTKFRAQASVWEFTEIDNNEYCRPELCNKNKRHVACPAKKRKRVVEYFGKKCGKSARLLPMDNSTKELILTTMNEMRDKVAHGGFDAFQPAARMATVEWDDELAYLARFNALQCELHRDSCRNTAKYKDVGQTVAFREVRSEVASTTNDAISHMLNLWFSEHEAVTMSDIAVYKHRHGQPKENFNQLMLENAHKVGCATALMMHNGWLKWYICCNYAHSPSAGKPIYESSPEAGSACQTGTNAQYENLCSVEEPYDEPTAATKGNTTTTTVAPAVVKRRTADKLRGKVTATATDRVSLDYIKDDMTFLLFSGIANSKFKRALTLAKERHVEVITSNHEAIADRPLVNKNSA